uniref:Uncharacterized protein n=1 Tax=Plectus sambesii TaxID=2011161 RepID=A0A914UVF7_9BILA
MTSDLEDGEIEDFEAISSSDAQWANRTLQFVYTGDDGQAAKLVKERRRSSSPYSPTNRLSPLQLDLPLNEHEPVVEGGPSNRVTGGYWAPLPPAASKNPTTTNGDLSNETADIPVNASSGAKYESLLKKYREYRDIREETYEVEREEGEKEGTRRKAGEGAAKVKKEGERKEEEGEGKEEEGEVKEKEGDEDELAEMQLRLAALESTLQRTQTRTADCLQRGELELNRNEVEDGELVEEEGELEEGAEDDDLNDEEKQAKGVDSSKSASQPSSRTPSERRSASRWILSPKRDKAARIARRSSRRSSITRTKGSERGRSTHDRESGRQSSSKSDRKRRRRSDSGDRRTMERRERLNQWQQMQREKILSIQDPDAQMKEFYKYLTTTSLSTSATTASSGPLDSSRRSMSRDATAPYSNSPLSTARADSVHDNYDALSMDLASDNEQRSPEEDSFPEVPPPPGVSPPALDLFARDPFGIGGGLFEWRPPSPPPLPPSEEAAGDEDEDDDDDAEAMRQSLLAQVQKKRKDSPPPDLLNKTTTDDMRIVIAPSGASITAASPSRVPIRSSDRSVQYGPNLVKTISNSERRVIGTNGELKVTMPVARPDYPTVSQLDARAGSEQNQPPVDQLLNQMLKDTRKRTDKVKAVRQQQQQQMPANFAALEERLKSCEADVEGHRDRVQEDRNRLRSLQALRGRYSLERRKAAAVQKRLLDQLAMVRAKLYKHESALVQLDPEIKMVEARLATKEKMLADFERQWNEIQALQAFVAKRKGLPLQEQQQETASNDSNLRRRKEQLEVVKKQTEASMTRLNPARAATVIEEEGDGARPVDSVAQNPLMSFSGNRVSPLFPSHLLTSTTFSNRLNCHVPLCPFALSGRCADETCPWYVFRCFLHFPMIYIIGLKGDRYAKATVIGGA